MGSHLIDIEQRLQSATGADRLIDFEFALMTDAQLAKDAGAFASVRYTNGEFMLFFEGVGARGIIGDHMVPYVTASLDAAVALVERVGFWASFDGYGKWGAVRDKESLALTEARAETPVLSINLALIRALIAKGDRHD